VHGQERADAAEEQQEADDDLQRELFHGPPPIVRSREAIIYANTF
jgi:hypothetical protein